MRDSKGCSTTGLVSVPSTAAASEISDLDPTRKPILPMPYAIWYVSWDGRVGFRWGKGVLENSVDIRFGIFDESAILYQNSTTIDGDSVTISIFVYPNSCCLCKPFWFRVVGLGAVGQSLSRASSRMDRAVGFHFASF